MPEAGKKKQKMDDFLEITHQEGDFDDDEEMEEEIKKYLKIQIEEQERIKNRELLEKRQRFIRLMNMYIKILDHYSTWLNKNEVKRITEALYFERCEDFTAKQLIRMESRAINIIRSNRPVIIPDARKLPESVLAVSLIHKKRWINPDKVHKYDFYGTLQREIEDKDTFDYLYEEAKSNGKRPREE